MEFGSRDSKMGEGRQDMDDKHGGDGELGGKDRGGCLPSSPPRRPLSIPQPPIPGMMSAFIDFVKPFPMLLPMCLQDSKSRSIRGDGGGARNAGRGRPLPRSQRQLCSFLAHRRAPSPGEGDGGMSRQTPVLLPLHLLHLLLLRLFHLHQKANESLSRVIKLWLTLRTEPLLCQSA